MKKLTLIMLGLFVAAGLSVAQSVDTYQADTAHYRVTSEISKDHAQAVADRLEALLSLYNTYFHFDLSKLPAKMKVHLFSTRDRYDSYLKKVINETRDNYVYLHYTDAEKSELDGYYVSGEDLTPAAIHQNFIQYLRAFVANPPLWLREGFAVFFESSSYDPTFKTAIFKENLSWLETLKAIVTGKSPELPLNLDQLLSINVDTAKSHISVFYPQSWGMVWYLVNTPDKNRNRILWDSISALQPGATLEENDQAVRKAAFTWVGADALSSDFVAYVDSRKSFRGLVQDGMDQYTANKLDTAEEAFIKALNLQDSSYVPYYYLGLINYAKHNYQLAEYYYKTALDKGATKPLSYYALGVNAYADNKFDEAQTYLKLVSSLDSGNLKEKAQELLKRIQS
ncbi:MAG TPA: DUF1570 domain-containing protein [Spirochaetia bacterium]|nr:DUF1570 domain-containing protein [Spirochaetia bacterium]